MSKIEKIQSVLVKVFAMREAQKNYFSLKKASGIRWQTKETKTALELSKKLESEVDNELKELAELLYENHF